MYDKALLATDFSASCEQAADLARRVAREVAVLHVVAPPMEAGFIAGEPLVGASISPSAWPAVAVELDVVADRLSTWCGEHCGGEARSRVETGEPASLIAHEADAGRADLIVLGAHAHSRLARFFGTTTTAVAKRAPCDVLVARGLPEERAGTFRRAIVATDFFEPASAAAERVRDLAPDEIVLAHVRERTLASAALSPSDPERALHDANERLFDGRAMEALLEGNAAKLLKELCEEREADLLVLGHHGAGPVERLVLGSVARALVETAPCSVLLVKGSDGGTLPTSGP